MDSSTNTIIDDGILESYRTLQDEGEPDVVTEFIDVFLEDLPGRIERLRAAAGSANPAEIRSAAHALKGSAASVGAVGLSGLCAQLEANARAGSTAGAMDLLAAIEPEAVRTRAELMKYRR
jgi:HPt (histidine-containing phosphotransfer) domain-containing protein